ncbi:hypothetical protein B0T26DRAFT_634897 [Lasiosphaeria miniovina]|uniref:Uncharacterized protein n=1 Tax=Lasiosphaeria miniovina TaxID=1954250 RepID=A0AA40EE47_9PEZI|nr:uncharacterized protein B0T26DRAFT_634897 [Lasiosphaeria miniovina]KAK0735052.1 hypothetical protein B0T26DRAFT_634897 [Lasiosphaeria miniovina]
MPPKPRTRALGGVSNAIARALTEAHRLPPLGGKKILSPQEKAAAAIRAREAFAPSTAVSIQNIFPPESPKHIAVREPPQSIITKLAPIRGHLPIPRDIFEKRGWEEKIFVHRKRAPEIDRKYIKRATPLSLAEKAGKPPVSFEEEQHRRLAALRRKALGVGLGGLLKRKQKFDNVHEARSKKNYERNLNAANAPEQLDEVMTRSTVRASTASMTAVLPDPNRFEVARLAREKHAALTQLKSEARRDALAQLYAAAGDFIVDEEDLERRVEEVFKETSFDIGSIEHGRSIWDVEGPPLNATNLRKDLYGTATNSSATMAPTGDKTTGLQRKVAEELIGGKL